MRIALAVTLEDRAQARAMGGTNAQARDLPVHVRRGRRRIDVPVGVLEQALILAAFLRVAGVAGGEPLEDGSGISSAARSPGTLAKSVSFVSSSVSGIGACASRLPVSN